MNYKSLLIAGLSFATIIGAKAQNIEKSNIIFILTDDMGIGDLSTYGSQGIAKHFLNHKV
jgi:hypothetical protein